MVNSIYTLTCPNGHRWISDRPFSSGHHLIALESEQCKRCGQTPREILQSTHDWTTEKPTMPGKYWYRAGNGTPIVVRVYDQRTPTPTGRMDVWVEVPGEADCNIDDMDGEWVGPLEPPE
jgi:hypothetical protein